MATHLFPKCRVKTLSAEHQRDFWWANEAHKNQGPTHLQKAQKKYYVLFHVVVLAMLDCQK